MGGEIEMGEEGSREEGYHDVSGRFSICAFLFRHRSSGTADSLYNKSNDIKC